MCSLWFYELPLLGRCGVEANNTCVTRVLLGREAAGLCVGPESSLTRETARQLAQYAVGERQQFELPIALAGTPFQQRVWQLLQEVPWGVTCTYGQLAAAIGKPGGARAVGNTVGANPLPVLIPCHRVLAAGGAMGGFRLGAELKRTLLKLEGIPCPDGETEKI